MTTMIFRISTLHADTTVTGSWATTLPLAQATAAAIRASDPTAVAVCVSAGLIEGVPDAR